MYNADFDGDQMAVHIPLSTEAQAEARVLMLSSQNLFTPADGRPTCAPVQDIVLGNYALTFVSHEGRERLAAQEAAHQADPMANPMVPIYASPDEVLYLLENPVAENRLHVNEPVKVRIKRPIFRPTEEIAFRDAGTGQEYYRQTTQNEDGDDVEEMVAYETVYETVIRTCTPGQLMLNTILPYPMRYADEYLQVELGKKQLAALILDCQRLAGYGATIKLLDDIKDMGFKWATKYGISVALTDMDPPKRRDEMINEADDLSNKITTDFRRGKLSLNEMTRQLTLLWQGTYDKVGKEIVNGLTQFNPLNIITVSGARGSIKQLAQLAGMRGLMLNQFNETIYELPVKSSFHKGLNMLEYFVTTHGARKGLADTALRTADAGYLTRRLCDVAQDVIVKSLDCETTEGIQGRRIVDQGQVLEEIDERIHGRVSLTIITDPETGESLTQYQEPITRDSARRIRKIENKFAAEYNAVETDAERKAIIERYMQFGFEADEHGYLSVAIRSPLTCELSQGICSKCYGLDLSTSKLVEVGVAVGIIAAQSIGEPGTQLTMRTFHTGGVAGAATIAKTNQYKTGKFIRQFMEDFAQATETDLKQFDPTQLLATQEKLVKNLFKSKDAAPLTINEPVDTEDPKVKRKQERATKAALKAAEKADNDSRKMWEKSRKTFFYSWTGQSSGIVRVEEIFEARRQPRGKAIICPVSGTVRDISETPYGRFVIVESTVNAQAAMKDAYISDDQPSWPKNEFGEYEGGLHKLVGQKLNTQSVAVLRKLEINEAAIYYPIHVPPSGNLPVKPGQRVVKGDPMTYGPRDPHEVLELAGAHAVYDYFIENLQSVYKSQGVDINDKHIEVIIRQMLRKRQVKEPGDTPFLPGQIVDRFTFQRANDIVRNMLAAGTKIRYVDPITGEDVERDAKESTATWILLGITEASLATDSFLSAASFQKTTRVLTEAAVRGKKDTLAGLKENVIIGRLIPAGTGVKQYRDIAVDVQRAPGWADQSLTSMVEADEELRTGYDELAFTSLADLAAEEVDE
jgi:DNA-directed RNA polymerase subunit beta'